MKSNFIYFLKIILSAVVLFISAYFSYPYFQKLTLLFLGNPPASIPNPSTILKIKLLFAITFAFFPLMTAFINFVFQAKGKFNYYIYLSMFLSMLMFYGVRLFNIHEMLNEEKTKFGENIIMQIPIEQLQIESFVFIGAMIGGIIGAVFMKRLQKKGKI